MEPGEYRLRAACRGHEDPDTWFPVAAASAVAQEAKRICRGCPVRRECGNDAVDHGVRIGIAGGYNTAAITDWRQLHIWLGRPVPRVTANRDARAVKCVTCKQTFRTRREDVSRCPQCVQGLVPSQPVQQRITDLRGCGLTNAQIAAAAGLSRPTITEIFRRQWVMRDTAARIFAVGAEATAVPA